MTVKLAMTFVTLPLMWLVVAVVVGIVIVSIGLIVATYPLMHLVWGLQGRKTKGPQ